MKIFLSLFLIFGLINISQAQIPEDAIRYSWFPHNGSARNMATGGVMGSLGGDITAAFVNPAGIGFFKTGEFVITPYYLSQTNKANYRENSTSADQPVFNIGPTGIIIGSPNRNKPKNSSAFSIAFNQTANFKNTIRYRASNNYSSFSEQFAEEFAKSGYSINDVLTTNSPLPYTSAPALYTYLIDTVSINGVVQIKAAPEYLLDSGLAVMQDMEKITGGGMYEIAFAFAGNINDKLYLGGTLGIPLVDFKSKTTFTESDLSGDTSNRFASFTYTDEYRSLGAGANLKLGVIYRPKDYFRIGFAVHTPSFMSLTDTRTTSIATQLENPVKNYYTDSRIFTNNQEGESRYLQSTPWKLLLSASYVFREVEDVKKQRGFISADIEYIQHRGSRFSSNNEEPTGDEKNYYKALNNVVKDIYKGTFNFRVGGELKFNVIMARLGFAYYGNPYKEEAFKADQLLLSGGLGYRNKGFFVDLSYVHNTKRSIDVPYRLEDRANSFAELKQKTGQIVATVGVKF